MYTYIQAKTKKYFLKQNKPEVLLIFLGLVGRHILLGTRCPIILFQVTDRPRLVGMGRVGSDWLIGLTVPN